MLREGSDGSNDVRGQALESAAQDAFAAGREAWPRLILPREQFIPYFALHATAVAHPRDLHAADMYLACACGHGVDGAVVALDRAFAAEMARAAACVDSSDAFVNEVLQAARERLLVRKGDQPGKILQYGGRASLRSWLCAVAARAATSALRQRQRQKQAPFAAGVDGRLAPGGPEFDYLRDRYKGAFEAAVRGAFERLRPRQRMLLRLNVVEGMSIDKLATAYGIGRSTAARWLASARRELLLFARRELHERLTVTSTELDGLARELCSQLEVSIVRLLATTSDAGRQP